MTHLYSLLVTLKLDVILATVEKLLVRVDLGLDSTTRDQGDEVFFDLLKFCPEGLSYLSHINDLVGSDVLLESFFSDLFIGFSSLVKGTEEGVVLHLSLDLVKLGLKLLKLSIEEVLKDICRLNLSFQQGEDRRVREHPGFDVGSVQVADRQENDVVGQVDCWDRAVFAHGGADVAKGDSGLVSFTADNLS